MADNTAATPGHTGRAQLILRGGTVIDGSGAAPRRADVAVEGGRIAAVGELSGWRADEEVDAAGCAVAPGFIDVHTHDDRAALANPAMDFKVSQGVTTVIAGNCGISLAPFRPGESFPEPTALLGGPDEFFPTVAAYRAALDRAPPALNLGLLTGHGMLRVEALGRDFDRAAGPQEIEAMGTRLREALAEGSLGLSSGLDYPNSCAASTDEVVALARHISDASNALYVSHIRDEGYASGQDRLPKTVRFCETDLMTVHKDSFQVQRLEVVNTGRRRRWSVAEKLRIVEESFQGHRQVSATACRHDISPSLLFSWRKAFRRGRDEVIGFAPALIVPDEEAPLGAAAAVGRMEIVTVTGQRIMVGADVDVLALARVVAALEAR